MMKARGHPHVPPHFELLIRKGYTPKPVQESHIAVFHTPVRYCALYGSDAVLGMCSAGGPSCQWKSLSQATVGGPDVFTQLVSIQNIIAFSRTDL